ncbi:MAG: hypothetical protein J6U43_06395 [Bacteroidales bacterium]|nr:hypothetical protein [Bacteroidales bacterium]
MKIKSLIYTSLASVLLFASCDLNKQPEFNDATQAFIAYDKTSGMVVESDGKAPGQIELTLYCASVAGINASTEISFSTEAYGDNGAVLGEHFNVAYALRYTMDYNNQSPTFNQRIGVDTVRFESAPYVINFDKDHRFAAIVLETVDNGVRHTNKKFDANLVNITGCFKGAMNSFAITILDDETPFNRLLGDYVATCTSAAMAEEPDPSLEWALTIAPDDSVANQLWIQPAVTMSHYGIGNDNIDPVAATFDEVQGTISMKLGQTFCLYGGGAYDFQVGAVAGNSVKTSGVAVANADIEGDVVITWANDLAACEAISGGLYEIYQSLVYTKQ